MAWTEPGKPTLSGNTSNKNESDSEDNPCIKKTKINRNTAGITKDFRRFRSKPKYVIDLFAGDHSLAKYYLRNDPRCRVLCVDIRSKEDSLRTVPKHLWNRIVYIQYNIKNLTYAKLKEWVYEAWQVSMSEVYHCHASPDCRTLSKADKGRSGYRLEDGSPNPYASHHHKQMVAEHDAALKAALQVMHEMAQKHPNTCLTIENPIGYFHMQPPFKGIVLSCHLKFKEIFSFL